MKVTLLFGVFVLTIIGGQAFPGGSGRKMIIKNGVVYASGTPGAKYKAFAKKYPVQMRDNMKLYAVADKNSASGMVIKSGPLKLRLTDIFSSRGGKGGNGARDGDDAVFENVTYFKFFK